MSNQETSYPLSQSKKIDGNRHLVREKVLQIVYAHYACQTPIPELINHIFNREFNFDEVESENLSKDPNKILRPEEVLELESDTQIIWNSDLIDFGTELINSIVTNQEYLDTLIDSLVKNWDISRIAPIDRILIQMAVAEFLHFPGIPIKVSMNEALDISKDFSTDKSSNFINGVLDTIYENLKENNKINKTGRGLIGA